MEVGEGLVAAVSITEKVERGREHARARDAQVLAQPVGAARATSATSMTSSGHST